MSESGETTENHIDEEPNLRPGQTDHGGHGGMATREQEERLYLKQHRESAENSDG